MVNLPTVITFSRILLIPLFIFVVKSKPFLGVLIFVLASSTDFLDGYIARKSRQVTKLGILLDPLADKLLVISAIIVFVDMNIIPGWLAIVIIAREFIVTGLRIVALSRDMVIPAEIGGKIKTITQFVSILILLVDRLNIYMIDYLENLFNLDAYAAGIVLLWISMFAGIASGIQYFILFWRRLS